MKTLLSTYLAELHIPFTKSYADRLFAEHPHRYDLYGLTATPTVLVNGYQMPDNYKIEDMRHFGDIVID